MLAHLWRFLHLLFAFSFVGALTLAEWNGRAARATADWDRRAALWGVVHTTTRVLGLGALVLLGLLGNLLAVALALPMSGLWMRVVNGVWLAGILVHLLVVIPAAGRLVSACAPGDRAAPYGAALSRWRAANVTMSVFYVVMLALMVLRPLLP